MQRAIGTPPSSASAVSGPSAGNESRPAPRARAGSRPRFGSAPREPSSRPRMRPSPGEWALFAYLIVVCAVTILGQIVGHPIVHAMASSPADVAAARLWPLVTSGLVVEGPFVPQVLATAVFGVAAMRLAGGRVFWSAAILAHILGTLLVYAGVWIADAASQSGIGIVLREADFGVSLVWCAALGVLAGVAWWKTRPLPRWAWRLLAVGPPAALLGVTLVSNGLAFYEHVVAFGLAVGLVYAGRRWSSVGARLRLLGTSDDRSR